MDVEVITRNLKEELERFYSFDEKERNNVYGHSFLLRLMHETILSYIKFSNTELSRNVELQISQTLEEQLLRIKFLYDDFLPMAHTDVSIGRLKIINRSEIIEEIGVQGNELMQLTFFLKDATRLLEKIDSRNTLLSDIVNQ
jgi:hypothetical protein